MRIVLVSALLVLALVPTSPASPADATFTVASSNFAWTPNDLTIAPGDTVNFVNDEGSHNWERTDEEDSCELPCTRTFETEGTVEYRCGIHTSMTGTIHVGAPPTVTVSTPLPGQGVTGILSVAGSASVLSGSIEEITVRIDEAAAVVATLSGPAGSPSFSANVPTTNVENGARTLHVRAEGSNGASQTVSVPIDVSNPIAIDLVVASALGQAGALTGNAIAFTLRNDGNAPTGAVDVLAEYLYHGSWRVIGTKTVASIAVGGELSSTLTWTLDEPRVGSFVVRVTADPDGTLPDPALANNVRETTAGWVTSAVPGVVLTEPV